MKSVIQSKNVIENKSSYNKLNDLMKRIEQLEKKVIQLERTSLSYDENGNEELKQGIEYIKTIKSGQMMDDYQWLDEQWSKCILKLEDVSGEWEINFRKGTVHLFVGAKIKFYIIGRKLTSYRILN